MVPTMGRCPRFPRPGCSGQVRTEGAQAATAAPQNLGFGRGGQVPLLQHHLEVDQSRRFPPVQILTYLDGMVKVEETDLKPRVGFLYPVLTHNISVFINATREHDSGQYMCTVNVVDDDSGTGKNVGVINLTVLGKAPLVALRTDTPSPPLSRCPSGLTSVPTVPPASPACQLHGNPTVGANVTLSCASEKGKPSPAYQWERTAPTLQVFFPPAQGKVAPGSGRGGRRRQRGRTPGERSRGGWKIPGSFSWGMLLASSL